MSDTPKPRAKPKTRAKSKAQPKAAATPPPATGKLTPKPRRRRLTMVSIKASPGYDRWFKALVRHARLTRSAVIELALVSYAKSLGFDREPPPR